MSAGKDMGTPRLLSAAKRTLRNVWWTARGLSLVNPPLTEPVRSLLFVCKGNICRSPFAEHRVGQLLWAAGRADVKVSSAGIRADSHARSPREACIAARRYGIELSNHVPVRLEPELVRSHDLIVVMEAAHLAAVRDLHPAARERVCLLPIVGGASGHGARRYNIDDPFGLPLDAYVACYARIDRDVQSLMAACGVASENPSHLHRAEAIASCR